jgi:hypothetical protein
MGPVETGNMLISLKIVALQTLHLPRMRTKRPFRYFWPSSSRSTHYRPSLRRRWSGRCRRGDRPDAIFVMTEPMKIANWPGSLGQRHLDKLASSLRSYLGFVRAHATEVGMSNSGIHPSRDTVRMCHAECDARKEVSIFVTLAPDLTEPPSDHFAKPL